MKNCIDFLTEVTELSDAMTDEQMLRASIISEQDATNLYLTFANRTKNPLLKKVFIDIAHEEEVHVHEFQTLLDKINPYEKTAQKQGQSEVKDME